MSELSPRLWDIRISYDLISGLDPALALLSDRAYRALLELVSAVAADLVWTWTAPGDGTLPDDDVGLARLARLSRRKWLTVRAEVEPFFTIKKGKWHLNRDWIAIDDRPIRFAIPLAIREQVLTREGKVCTYCGNTDGPFDFDHILPVSRGGPNDPSNLTLACASCNRSKGGKTLREWFEWSR